MTWALATSVAMAPAPSPRRTSISWPQVACLTNAYATAATCTPSRYSLLTGSYPWRNKDARILAGDAPLIIEPGSSTMPELMRGAGYRTGIVGKWHLGLGDGSVDWNGDIDRTPLDVGFERSYIMAATNDRVPCVYIDQNRVDGLDPDDKLETCYDESAPDMENELPRGKDHHDQLRVMYSHGHDGAIVNGVSRIGRQAGGTSALWTDETMGEVFSKKPKNSPAKPPTTTSPSSCTTPSISHMSHDFHRHALKAVPNTVTAVMSSPKWIGAPDNLLSTSKP